MQISPVAGSLFHEKQHRDFLKLVQWQTEGQITKLKLVKRQMCGRGKLDLLQARLIGAAGGHVIKIASEPLFDAD